MNNEYSFIVKLTTKCPGNCKSCINRKENFQNKKQSDTLFDLELFEDICKKIKSVGGEHICLSGGEPTIINNLEAYIIIAKKNNLITRIVTNGRGITKETMEKWLILGLDQVVLSIYGTTPKLVLKTRGNVVIFNKAKNAIAVLKKMKKKYNFLFIIQTIIMKDNYKNLPGIYKTAISANADLFRPSYLEDSAFLPDIRMEREDINIFTKSIIPRMIKITEKAFPSLKQQTEIIRTLKKYYYKKYPNNKYHTKNYKCKRLGHHLTFYPNGVVDPCPGHEYFPSDAQMSINKNNVNNIISKANLEEQMNLSFDYCQFCPQGEHIGINLTREKINEYDKKRKARLPV